ncbi:hypothetical protein L596_030040 [Steinernema carpocapsae]|uniref:Aspartyl/asparaginy/proline hydroxylase domain-containing protein n=1 Tax=Steinernema carpocapsae TaxID=34508 RepID=A0A4U5LRJ9_STECR|nr:hypothetical protein L596_030040 [Steinernema carpocapsae]
MTRSWRDTLRVHEHITVKGEVCRSGASLRSMCICWIGLWQNFNTFLTKMTLRISSSGRLAAGKLIECARFRGNLYKVLQTQRSLIDRFPEDLQLQNDFGITFVMMGRPDDAKNVFRNILETDPHDNVALSYLGYIHKFYDGDIVLGVALLKKGLKAEDPRLADAKFYYHLGDGLTRLGRISESHRVYEIGADLGLFPSSFQRSLYNIEGLSAKPWWTVEQTGCSKYLKTLEREWIILREEAVALWKTHREKFLAEDNQMVSGDWVAYYIHDDGEFVTKNCEFAPKSCDVLKHFIENTKCFKAEVSQSLGKRFTRCVGL